MDPWISIKGRRLCGVSDYQYGVRMDHVRGIVNTGTSAKQEVVHRLEVGDLLAGLENVVLRSTKVEGFFALRLRAGQHDNVATHG